jgi:hypothetical protein
MKPIKFILLTGLVGFGAGLVYYWRDSVKTVELIPGEKYLVIANAIGDEDTNWNKVANELDKLKLTGYKMTRNGKKGLLTYIINSTGFSKIRIGQPLFQIEGVQFIARDIDKL